MTKTEGPFPDVPADHWAASEIEQASEEGVVSGNPDGNFKPDAPTKRDEAVVMLMREANRFEDLVPLFDAAMFTVYNVDPSTGKGDLGSGTHIGGGLIVTNHHVVAVSEDDKGNFTYRDEYTVTNVTHDTHEALPPEAKATAKLVAKMPQYDIAVLKRDNQLQVKEPAVKLGTEKHVKKGRDVVAYGSPYGLAGTMTRGIISNPRRVIDYYDKKSTTKAVLLQTDAEINPGNSGGALFTRTGHLIAIPCAGLRGADGIGLAIRIDSLVAFLKEQGITVPAA